MLNQQSNNCALIDIGSVFVRKDLSREQRIRDFAAQLGGNPYHFLCSGFVITVSYADTRVTIEDRLRSIVS